jgi:hypothetical protein
MPSMLEAARAEALFVSDLQASDKPTPDEVRAVVGEVLRHLRVPGCVALVATEFGDHPDIAAGRMAWALGTVHAVYGERPATPLRIPARTRLAFAS